MHTTERPMMRSADVHSHVKSMEEVTLKVLRVHGGASANHEEADDGSDDASASHPEGESHTSVIRKALLVVVDCLAVCGHGQGGSCHDGANVTLEEVSTHAGNITDVVADIVCNGGRVVVGVLGEV